MAITLNKSAPYAEIMGDNHPIKGARYKQHGVYFKLDGTLVNPKDEAKVTIPDEVEETPEVIVYGEPKTANVEVPDESGKDKAPKTANAEVPDESGKDKAPKTNKNSSSKKDSDPDEEFA